jgi:hypothetical protein
VFYGTIQASVFGITPYGELTTIFSSAAKDTYVREFKEVDRAVLDGEGRLTPATISGGPLRPYT